MRPQTLILPVSLLVMASSAGAQEQRDTQSAPESVSQVQVTAEAPPFQFRDYEAQWVSGGYHLSNGWGLKVDAASDGIVAQINKERPIRLVAVSQNRYITRNGTVVMEFNRGAEGDEMLMSYVPDSRTAQRVVVTSTLAQR
jgi:hypothetical protein